jgi:peroxiredoxin
MKTMKMFAAALLFTAAACNSVPKGDDNNLAKGKLKLSGEISGMDTGKLEILFPIADTSFSDSIAVVNNKFTYEVELPEPVNMLLRIAGTRGEELSVFADPGTMTIKASRDSFYAAKVEGGVSQKIYKQGEDSIRKVMDKGQELYMQFMAAQQLGDTAKMKDIENAFVGMQEDLRGFIKTYASNNKNSVVAAYYGLMYLIEPGKEDEIVPFYESLTPAVKKSYFGKKLGDVAASAKTTAIGQIAPEFSQADTSGNTIALSSLRGKYLLIDFWASWCGPCRQENPNIVKAYNTYKDKGFEILGVSLDQDKAAWLDAIYKDKLTWKQVSDLKYWNNAAAQLYGVRSIPANYLLDPQGKIIAKNLRGADLEAKLSALFASAK